MEKKKTKKTEAVVIIAVMIFLTAASVTVEAEESIYDLNKKWDQTFGREDYTDQAYSVDITSDGGFIIAGYTHTIETDSIDIYYIKTDEDGNEEWSKTIGTEQYSDYASCVQQTADGGYIITGHKKLKQFPYSEYLYLIKTFEDGSIDWERSYLGGKGYCVQQTADGGYIVSGNEYLGGDKMWLLKTCFNGYKEWSKNFSFGFQYNEAYWVEQTEDDGDGDIDDGYIVTGHAYFQCILLKVNHEGVESWHRSFANPNTDSVGYCVKQTEEGGYIICGKTNKDLYRDAWLIKTDPDGYYEWDKTYGSTDDPEGGRSIDLCDDGGYIITGFAEGSNSQDVYLIKTDSTGEPEASDYFGRNNDDIGYSVKEGNAGCYIIAGSTDEDARGENDMYLLKVEIWPQFDNTYYFDGYNPNEAWENDPENMIDDNKSTFASTYATYNNQVELCDSNTCNGIDYGTIMTVKMKVWGYKKDTYCLLLRPIFNGNSEGRTYNVADIPLWPQPPGWSSWADVTNDPKAPDIWSWDDVKNLHCDIEAWQIVAPVEGPIYCGKVEIQVRYY